MTGTLIAECVLRIAAAFALLGFSGCSSDAPMPSGQPTFYRNLAEGGQLDPDAAQSMISGYRANNGLGGVVKNWTHANTLGRVNIKLAVSYASDAEKVMAILRACVIAHPEVLKQPEPAIQLSEFGASAMMFDIFCIVPNLADRGRIKSDIHVAILREFRACGIEMSPPQDVRLIGGAAAPGTKPG